ncbi:MULTISPECIES: YbdK family carboxylate-amine ligase [Kitasatospora]|uniref:Putative glutamate--cysteine ligase 2 n=1 Tax=Kitasatospora setae (strain ATCC 33774 / DSM 43861 / JCM 3304 / KCC A-0304 / NBRC 14216 / KM-6054) TaxID=452652 RepID=E4N5U9_KITSK|nr:MULTISPECIES: YbdK family carboxylate-amine ligase [Kitasatospora]BAJ26580.1 putative carboxylate-amine ligase [Kitasatospora setae KM-6054]
MSPRPTTPPNGRVPPRPSPSPLPPPSTSTSPLPPLLRFGVEEEFLLTGRRSRVTVPAAGEVVADAARTLGPRAQHEFLATQVEGCTRPVTTAAELRAELADTRDVLQSAADRADCRIVATGTAVLPSRHPLPVTPQDRYLRLADRIDGVADQVGAELCGCHVHLGDLTHRQALSLSARIRGWLPLFQAFCANSPFCEGIDRGNASNRPDRYARWPTFGPAPVLDEPGYRSALERLLADGVILDRRMLYWYARPSEHLPTLEVRIADSSADLDTVLLLAVLLRALAHTLLDPHVRARPRLLPDPVLRRAHRSAAVGGLDARLPDPLTGALRPVRRLLPELVEFTAGALRRTDELGLARDLTGGLLATGCGADRQRAALARHGHLSAVVDDLAERTAAR